MIQQNMINFYRFVTIFSPDRLKGGDAKRGTMRTGCNTGNSFSWASSSLKAVHRPQQNNLPISDLSRGDEPWRLLAAEFLFVGDFARPGLVQGRVEGATQLCDLANPGSAELPDFAKRYPAHVSGSTASRPTSVKFVTTLGYERRFNPALVCNNKEDFVAFMHRDQPVYTTNVSNIVAINQGMRQLTEALPDGALISAADDLHIALQGLAFPGLDRRVRGYLSGGMGAGSTLA
jgi:hypothetical protein